MRSSLFALLLCASLHAEDWTKTDIGLEVANQALLLVDWRQTSGFHNQPINETNWALGHHPAQRTINRYFIGASLAHWGIASWLTGNRRRAWELATVTIEASYVNHNAQIGARVTW